MLATTPSGVRKALRYANDECTRQGGGAVSFAPDTVRKLDLSGDGRDDYIVDFRETVCADREVAYCGTGGCRLDILVTLPNGKIRSVFSDRVRAYEILARGRPHHPLRAARLLLRRPRQSILHQRVPHHGKTVRVQDAEVNSLCSPNEAQRNAGSLT